MVRFIDNESMRSELDTSKFLVTGVMDSRWALGLGMHRKYFGCHFDPVGLIYKMRGNCMSHHGRG